MRGLKFILVVLVVFAAGCGMNGKMSSDTVGHDGGYQVMDDAGNVLTFSAKPLRVYATTLSIEELLVDLLPAERIAAISEDAADPTTSLIAAKAANIPVKLPRQVTVEQILALQPDLVIVQENGNAAFIGALQDVGLRVYVVDVATTVDKVRSRIGSLAMAVGEKERGDFILSRLNHKLAMVQKVIDQIPEDKKKILVAYSQMGAFGSAQGLFNDICIYSGVVNGVALAGLDRGQHLSKEKVIEVNPDSLLFSDVSSAQQADNERFRQSVLQDPALQNIKAIQNEDVIVIKDRYRCTASQYIGDAVVTIARKAYPNYFPSVGDE